MMVDPEPLTQSVRRQSLVYAKFGAPHGVLDQVERDLPALEAGHVRVAMTLAPINPSDLIPITGAYAHRITLPAVAGYEGVGRVIDASPGHECRIGQRVLPLRGEGTWQTLVDCPAKDAVKVPDAVPDRIAARAYINPLTAFAMLRVWPARGKTVLLCGAGSTCADLLGQWALRQGANKVVGLYRSAQRRERLRALGVEAMAQTDRGAIAAAVRASDIVFDSVGGPLGSNVLGLLPKDAAFVSYGLLSGQPISTAQPHQAAYHRFHLRDHLGALAPTGLASAFHGLWPQIQGIDWPATRLFASGNWRDAIRSAREPGMPKSLLQFSGHVDQNTLAAQEEVY